MEDNKHLLVHLEAAQHNSVARSVAADIEEEEVLHRDCSRAHWRRAGVVAVGKDRQQLAAVTIAEE